MERGSVEQSQRVRDGEWEVPESEQEGGEGDICSAVLSHSSLIQLQAGWLNDPGKNK